MATAAERGDDTAELLYTVPKQAIGSPGPGDVVTGLFMESSVFTSAGELGSDRAPDADFGRDYVLPAPVAQEPSLSYEPVEGDEFILEVQRNGTDGILIHNWTAPEGELLVTADGEATGFANVSLVWANGTRDLCNCTGNFSHEIGFSQLNASQRPSGSLQVRIEYAAFNGTLALHMAVLEPHEDPDPTGNTTDTSPPPGEGSPLPVVGALAALAIAARRRRANP